MYCHAIAVENCIADQVSEDTGLKELKSFIASCNVLHSRSVNAGVANFLAGLLKGDTIHGTASKHIKMSKHQVRNNKVDNDDDGVGGNEKRRATKKTTTTTAATES